MYSPFVFASTKSSSMGQPLCEPSSAACGSTGQEVIQPRLLPRQEGAAKNTVPLLGEDHTIL
jgi:hypothetical protein